MEHFGGYPANWFVNKPSSHFICGICLDVMNNPHQCKNGHSFCFSCISSALEVNRECPTCKTALKPEYLGSSLVLKNMIGELVVKCNQDDEKNNDSSTTNNDDRCEWTGTLDECLKHFECCEHRVVTCPLSAVHCCIEDCGGKIKKKDKLDHITSISKVQLAETICKLTKIVEMQQKEIKLYQNLCFSEDAELMTLDNGNVCFGTFHDSGAINGLAIVRVKDDAKVMVLGNYMNGERNGFGVNYNEASIYRGEFKNEVRNGQGMTELGINRPGKHTFYHGTYKDGLPDRYGTIENVECTYTGEHTRRKYNGEGVLTFYDGRVYKGKFQNNMSFGPGVMTNPDGSVFTGAVTYDYGWFEGKCVRNDGVVFEGTFNDSYGLDDEINGKGTITYTDGAVYTGKFLYGVRYGQGTLVKATGESVSGEWEDNELVEDLEDDDEEQGEQPQQENASEQHQGQKQEQQSTAIEDHPPNDVNHEETK